MQELLHNEGWPLFFCWLIIWTEQGDLESRRNLSNSSCHSRAAKGTEKHSANCKVLSPTLSISIWWMPIGNIKFDWQWVPQSLGLWQKTHKVVTGLEQNLKKCWNPPYDVICVSEARLGEVVSVRLRLRLCVLHQHWLIGFTAQSWHFHWPKDHLWDRVLAPMRVDQWTSEQAPRVLMHPHGLLWNIWQHVIVSAEPKVNSFNQCLWVESPHCRHNTCQSE